MKIIALLITFSLSVFSQSSSLKILTINVWSGLDYHGNFKMGEYETPARKEARFKLLLNKLKVLKPDVIFLQEANPVGKFSARLADSLSFEEIHQVCNAGIKISSYGIPSNLKEGITILANPKLELDYYDSWKLSSSFGIIGEPLSVHFSESNFALVGKIKVEGMPFYLINVHLLANVPGDSLLKIKFENYCKQNSINQQDFSETLEKWEDKIQIKKEEFEELTDKLNDLPKEYPFIVGGDFNTSSSDSGLKSFIKENKLLDTFVTNNFSLAYTWDPEKNENISYSTNFTDADGNRLKGYDIVNSIYDSTPRRIDYIFLDNHFNPGNIANCKIILDSASNGTHTSDHFGVITRINVENILKNSPKEFDEVIPLEDHTIEPLPIISYDTDVGFGYGAKAFFLNLLNDDESFDATLFNSTKGERWYRFVFSIPDFELRQGKIYPVAIDLTIDYDKYIKNNFFGIGNKSNYNDNEEYTKEPLEIGLNFSRGFSKNFVGQFGLKYKIVRNFNYSDTSKLLELNSSFSAAKVNFSSLNFSLRYDTRNSFINPSKGVVLSGETEYAPQISFTNTSFVRYAGYFQYYSLLFYPKTVFAFRAGIQALNGTDLPVQVLLPIGGNNTLRGYPQDRFLDETSAILNAELRFPICWRFGGVLGIDAGKVWDSIAKIDLKDWVYNPMFGLRFYMDTFIIRLDVGMSEESTGFYLNFGHIF